MWPSKCATASLSPAMSAMTSSFYGSFHHVRENDSIVQTFTFADFPDGVSLERLTLTALDDGRRTRLVATSLVDSFETRDAMISSGMETGIIEGYTKLDTILAEDTPP